MTHKRAWAFGLPMLASIAGCGGAASAPSKSASQPSADAKSAATGDIPDNQAFLTYRDPSRYRIEFPEGWARRGSGTSVTFEDKANTIEVRVRRAAAPTLAGTQSGLEAERRLDTTITPGRAQAIHLKYGAAIMVRYSRRGKADPVTGKRPLLLVDRYVYGRAGRVATVDLATPKGVDNVDAYRMISNSFRWR